MIRCSLHHPKLSCQASQKHNMVTTPPEDESQQDATASQAETEMAEIFRPPLIPWMKYL